jgi:hypothetical protein
MPLFLLFNTHTMHIKSFYTQQHTHTNLLPLGENVSKISGRTFFGQNRFLLNRFLDALPEPKVRLEKSRPILFLNRRIQNVVARAVSRQHVIH